MDFEVQDQGEADEIMAPREDLLGYDDDDMLEEEGDIAQRDAQSDQAADEEEGQFRSEPTDEAAPSNSRINKQSARERQPISWHAWAKDAKPDDTAQQDPERPRRSRERSPAQHQRRATDRHDSMRPIMPRASDAPTLDRRVSDVHRRGRSPRRRSVSPGGRRATYRSHSSREVAPYPYEPRSAVLLPHRPSSRPPSGAWPELYDTAPRRDPVRRNHSERAHAPLRAETPWDGDEYDRHYPPPSHPPASYPYPEPEYPAPAYRHAPLRHADPREHLYEQPPLDADFRQPLYPPSREPHRDHGYSRSAEVAPEPYVRAQPAWDILRNDGYDRHKQPIALHEPDERWHELQPDRQPLHTAPRGPRQAPHHAPRYSVEDYVDPHSSEAGYPRAPRHATAEPRYAVRSRRASLEPSSHQDLQIPPELHSEESRSLHRYPSASRPAPASRYPDDSRPAPRYAADVRQAPRYAEDSRHAPRAPDEPRPASRYAEPTHLLPRHAEDSRHALRYADKAEHASRYADKTEPAPRYAEDSRHASRHTDRTEHAPRYADPGRPAPRHADKGEHAARYADKAEHASRYADTARLAPRRGGSRLADQHPHPRDDRVVGPSRHDERSRQPDRSERPGRPASRELDRHRLSSRPAADASHAEERSGHQSSRPDRAERERADRDSRAERERESRPARDLPSRTARLEASRGKATDKAAEPNLPPPPTQIARTLQEGGAAAPKPSRKLASTVMPEQPQTETSEHKGDSSPELNVEQGFLTASHTPSKSQLDSKAQQAGSKEVVGSQQDPSGSSKHAQRDRAADQHAETKERQQRHSSSRDEKADTQHDSSKAKQAKQEAGKAAQPSNRYTEDRRRREAEAAKGSKAEGSKAEDLKQHSEGAATDLEGKKESKVVAESSRHTDKTKPDKVTKSASIAKTDTVPKSNSSPIVKASASQALSSPSPKLAASPKQQAPVKPDALKATAAAKPVMSRDKEAAVAKASDAIPDKASSGKGAESRKDQESKKDQQSRKVEESRKDEQSGKDRHSRQSSGAARLTGQKRRERSPAHSASPERKASSPPSRTAGKTAERRDRKMEPQEELPLPPTRQPKAPVHSPLPPPPARAPERQDQHEQGDGADAIEPGEVLLPPPPPKPLPKAAETVKNTAEARHAKPTAAEDKPSRTAKASAHVASPKQKAGERPASKAANGVSKDGSKQVPRDKDRSKQEPAAATRDSQSHKESVPKDKDSRAQKPALLKDGKSQQPDAAKDNQAKKAVVEKSSRKRSRSRSRSRSPAKRGSSSHLNGKDSRAETALPDSKRPSRASQQTKGVSEKDLRKEWMYSDNSKTHGPVSLSKLRDVLKNLEQDKHKQKASEFLRLKVWRDGDTRRTLQMRDVI